MSATVPAGPSWPDLISALLRGEDLTAEQAGWAMGEVMPELLGRVDPAVVRARLREAFGMAVGSER